MIFGMNKNINESNRIAKIMKNLSKWIIGSFLLSLLMFFFAAACVKNAENVNEQAEQSIESSYEAPVIEEREAVLLKGNDWISGIPGFDINGFSALSGVYRLEGLAAADSTDTGERGFYVYVTRELLFMGEEWLPVNTGTITSFERSEEDEFFTVGIMEDSQGGSWSIVFHFPFGLKAAGLSHDLFIVIFRNWINRFQYFLFQINSPSDLSLPAVVEF